MAGDKTLSLEAVGIHLNSRKHVKLDFAKQNPIAQAVVDKLVKQREPINSTNGIRRGIDAPDGGWLTHVSDQTAGNINDSSNLYQLLPDTELAQQVLVSSILSPKDMVKSELTFGLTEGQIEGELAGPLLKVVEDHFRRTYKIEPLLGDMLKEQLFTKGSYPLLVLPETTIDDVINSPHRVSMESLGGELFQGKLVQSIGILGPAVAAHSRTVSLESMINGTYDTLKPEDCVICPTIKGLGLTVTDNPSAVKMPGLLNKMRQHRLHDTLTRRQVGLESYTGRASLEGAQLSPNVAASGPGTLRAKLEDNLYRKRHYQTIPILPLMTPDTLERRSVGHPMVMKLPPECLIPVHVPGSPHDHLGYFLLLDVNGHPLSSAANRNHYNDLAFNMNSSKELTSQLINTARRGVEGRSIDPSAADANAASQCYAQLVEADLLNRLNNGLNGKAVQIARPEEAFRIMMARTYANLQTQVLYVPAEMLTYMAFDYNDAGVGKSLLEDNKILASIRAMLLFANTMQSIKASVGHTGLKIDLDPVDPDPASTVEYLMHEYAKNRQSAYPLGASNPRDLVNFLQNAGIDLQVSGNAGYPETRMEVVDQGRTYTKPDTDLTEQLKKDYLMSLGLSPETVDATYNVEFATTAVSSNLLLTKRVMLYQDKFCSKLSQFVRMYTMYSETLMEALRRVLEANKAKIVKNGQPVDPEEFLVRFVGCIEVNLPRPEGASLEQQMEAFEKYSTAVDAALAAYMDSSFMDSAALGEVDGVFEAAKAAVKAYLLREWLRTNNVLPELADFATFTKDKKPVIDMLEKHTAHADAMAACLEGLTQRFTLDAEARAKRKEEFEKANDVQVDDLGGGGGGGDDMSADDGGGDDLGGDDFGDDDDLGGGDDLDDAPPDDDLDNPPEEEENEEEEPEGEPDIENTPQSDVVIQPKH